MREKTELSNLPKKLTRRTGIFALLAVLATSTGCKREEDTQRPELIVNKDEAKVDNEKESRAKEKLSIGFDCRLLLSEVIRLKRKADAAWLKQRTSSREVNGPDQEREELQEDWNRDDADIFKGLQLLNECELNENLKQHLFNLTTTELIDLIIAIEDGTSGFMKIDLDKLGTGQDVSQKNEGSETESAEEPSQNNSNKVLIINTAFEAIFERDIKNEELDQFLNLLDLINLTSDETSLLNRENIEKLKIMMAASLRKKLDEKKDLGLDAILILGLLGEEGAIILFDFLKITSEPSKIITTLESLTGRAQNGSKLKKYLWNGIRNSNFNEEMRVRLLRMASFKIYNKKIPLIDEENVPFLMQLIKKGSPEISIAALMAFNMANDMGLVGFNQLKEIEKILIERGKKKDNNNACSELIIVNEWDSGNSEEIDRLKEKICEEAEREYEMSFNNKN